MPLKLRNRQWQSALDAAEPHLKAFQAKLDAMSNDIRVLEKYLMETGFRIDVRVTVSGADSDLEMIGWAGSSSDAWRIWYMSQTEDPGQMDQWEWKPLIETPAATRWRVAEAVPRLLIQIGYVAGGAEHDEPTSEPLTDEDIPF